MSRVLFRVLSRVLFRVLFRVPAIQICCVFWLTFRVSQLCTEHPTRTLGSAQSSLLGPRARRALRPATSRGSPGTAFRPSQPAGLTTARQRGTTTGLRGREAPETQHPSEPLPREARATTYPTSTSAVAAEDHRLHAGTTRTCTADRTTRSCGLTSRKNP